MSNGLYKGTLLITIKSIYSELTASEKRVAKYIVDDPEAAVYYTITELGQKASVCDTTIIRFCRKLGFRGYSDFRIELTLEVSSTKKESVDAIAEEDDATSIIKKLSVINNQAIEQTLLLLDSTKVMETVKLMQQCKKIHFYGVGMSGIVGLDAKFKLMRLGLNVESLFDSHTFLIDASLVGPDDIVFGLSHSGDSQDVVAAMKLAKKRGAHTVAITHYQKSAITKYSDIVLLEGLNETYMQSDTLGCRIAQYFVIDVLYTTYFYQHTSSALSHKSKTLNAIADRFYNN